MYDMNIRDMEIEEMKMWIIMVTGWKESVFNSMNEEQIQELYRERVEERGK